jgi:replicative DNA helicase
VPLNELFSLKEKVYEEVSKLSGKLIVKEYPTRSATIGTLKSHLEKMKLMGHTPDVIIVDYADLLKPTSFSKDEKRHQLETIYEELRGLSQIHACPLWTASQTNRSGLNAEVITMEAISEAFNKCFVADFIFSISRTIDDKAVNAGRVFIAKNRNGPDGMVYPIFMDTSNVTIKVFEPSSTEDLVDIRARAKEKMKKIKDIYKEHKKEQKKNGIIK